MTRVYFYIHTSDEKTLNPQTAYITTKNVDLMAGVDIDEPMFTVTGVDVAHINYCFIERFNRYYFVKWKLLQNGMYQAICRIDPMNSFADYIKGLKVLVTRQEYKYDDYLIDNNITEHVKTITQKKRIGSIGNTISYVLTVTGGGGQ